MSQKTVLPELAGKRIAALPEPHDDSKIKPKSVWDKDIEGRPGTIIVAWITAANHVAALIQWDDTKLLSTWHIENDTRFLNER